MDTAGNPAYLCQFGKIDFDGLVRSCSPSQFILHMIYLMEMVEHQCKQVRITVYIILKEVVCLMSRRILCSTVNEEIVGRVEMKLFARELK